MLIPSSPATLGASSPQPATPVETRSLTTTYANMFRASGSAEELILDFGLDAHRHGDDNPEAIVMLQRLILTWNNAKQLARILNELIHIHDKNHGQRQPPSSATPPQT